MARFTAGELNVMRLLWKHGEMKPAEIQTLIPEPIKNPALRSYLTILLEKNHVSRRKVGKAFFYKAVTKKQAALRKSLRSLIDTYCGGSAQELLMNLIRTEKLSEDELLELRRMAGENSLAVEKTKTGRGKKTTRKKKTKASSGRSKP